MKQVPTLFKILMLGTLLTSSMVMASSNSKSEWREDAFFAYSTGREVTPYEDDGKVMVLVKATFNDETRSKSFPAIIGSKEWIPYDDQLFAQQSVNCKVILGNDIVPVGAYEREQKVKYKPLSVVQEREDAPQDQWAIVYQYTNYERPDETIFKKRDHPLFQTKFEEKEEFKGQIEKCVREWKEFCFRGFNSKEQTRHQINTYNIFSKVRIEYKKDLNGLNEQQNKIILQDNIEQYVRTGEDGRCRF